MRIDQLQPGDHFRQPELGVVGTLVRINGCRARVRIGPGKSKGFEAKGEWVEFVVPGGQFDNWAPSVEVEVLSDVFEESGVY